MHLQQVTVFEDLKIVTQTDNIEKGGMMDDCAWASLAAVANYITGSKLTSTDGIAIGEKVGRHDRDGKGDGSSIAQLVKAAPLVGLKARYANDWYDVMAALSDPKRAICISVQQPIGYPASVGSISKWHKDSWTPWAKKNKTFDKGYGHITSAAGHAIGAQWACPTRSGKKNEKLAIPVTFDDLKKIASSHGDAPHKRVIIFSAKQSAAVVKETTHMEKIKSSVASVLDSNKLGAMGLDAIRTFLTVSISVALGLGIPLLDINGGDFRVILSAGLSSALQVVVKALDPNQSEYGIVKKVK